MASGDKVHTACLGSASHYDSLTPAKQVGLVQHLQPAAMLTYPSPMLCMLVAEPFDNPAWIFEPKYDGLRVLGCFDGRDLTLLSRNHESQNFQFPDVVAALRNSLTQPVIVDGEVICLDEHGRSSFWSLQQRFHLKNARAVEARMPRRTGS